MWLSTALSALTTNDVSKRRERRWRRTLGGRRSSRPRLEALEERALLSAWTVTDNSDNPSDTGSLRYNVENAPSGSTINFASNVTGTITLSFGNALAAPLPILQNLDIEGPGANNLTISGNGWTPVFEVSSTGTTTISGLTIADGMNVVSGGGGIINSVL